MLEVAHASVSIERVDSTRKTVWHAILEIAFSHAKHPIVVVRVLNRRISLS